MGAYKKKEYNKGLLWCSDFCVDKNEVWMLHGESNALIYYNMCTKIANILTQMPDTRSFQEYSFIKIIKYVQKLVIVPYFADYLFVYDLEQGEFIFQKNMRVQYKSEVVFSDACLVDNKLYCIPLIVGEPITVLDLEDLKDVQYTTFENELCNNAVINHCYCDGSIIYCVMPEKDYLLKFDIAAKKTSLVEISGVSGISGIAGSNDKLYLAAANENKLIVWQKATERIISQIELSGISGAICEINADVVWVDTNQNSANIVNVKKKNVETFDKLFQKGRLMNPVYGMGPSHNINGNFFYFNRFRSSIVQYDGKNWSEHEVRIDTTEDEEYIDSISLEGEIVKENVCIGLEYFIEILSMVKA